MSATTGDHSLLFKRVRNRLIGLSRTYFDDMLRAGTPSFLSEFHLSTSSRFQTEPAETAPCDFTGRRVHDNRNSRHPSHECYISRLQLLNESATYKDIRSARAKLA